jgi:N-methylhydantoinase B
VIKESQDFTFSILDGRGRMVAQGVPQPLHIGGISAQTQEVLRKFKDRMAPGDAYVLNHPYQACQNHATDVTIVSPVFFRGELAAMVGNTAHKPDLGGKVPGTNSPDATDLMQEGLLLPALRLYRDEQVNEDIKEIIWANTRTPEVTWAIFRLRRRPIFTASESSPNYSKATARMKFLAVGSVGWLFANRS